MRKNTGLCVSGDTASVSIVIFASSEASSEYAIMSSLKTPSEVLVTVSCRALLELIKISTCAGKSSLSRRLYLLSLSDSVLVLWAGESEGVTAREAAAGRLLIYIYTYMHSVYKSETDMVVY